MRQTVLRLLPASLLLLPALASADPARLNNPAPPVAPTVAAPPPVYDAPPTVQPGYNAPPPVTGYNAPPPVGHAQPVMMAQPQPYGRPLAVATPPAPARQGLFVGVLGGAAIPVVGEYGDYLSTGFTGFAHIGWTTGTGVSVRAELGARSNAFVAHPETSYTSLFYGAALRWTAPRGVFRPYLEGIVDAFSVLQESVTDSSGTVTTTTSSSGGTGVSLGAAAGAEIELSNSFALELAVRYDHIVLSPGEEGGTGGLVSVLGGGTYYF